MLGGEKNAKGWRGRRFYFGKAAAETVFLGTFTKFQASFGGPIWEKGTTEPEQNPESLCVLESAAGEVFVGR